MSPTTLLRVALVVFLGTLSLQCRARVEPTRINRAHTMNNSERMTRGLPPAAPRRLYVPTRVLKRQSNSPSGVPDNCPIVPSLGTAANYVILAKTGVSNVPTSLIVGDLGISPIARTAYTGFSETPDASGEFSTSAQVLGRLYAASDAGPTPANLGVAIGDMQGAYTEVSGRANPNFVELGGGSIGGLTLTGGIYKWSSGVNINSDVTLQPSASGCGTFLFQIAGGLSMGANTNIILGAGVDVADVFFSVGGEVVVGGGASFRGSLLGQVGITLQTGASSTGHLFSQSMVTLQQNIVN